MTKDDLWKIYCGKNPAFADDDALVTLTSRGLKKLFGQTWDMAMERGRAEGVAAASKSKSRLDEFFGKGGPFR